MSLRGKVTLLTGATGGIGKSIVDRLDKEGVRLVLFGRTTDWQAPAGVVHQFGIERTLDWYVDNLCKNGVGNYLTTGKGALGMASVHDVADYFLDKQDEDAGEVITHLKLQKLLYYAQGFQLALTGDQLFGPTIKAWAHGPVVPVVWAKYKKYESAPLPRPRFLDPAKLSDDERELLDEVWAVFGQYSAWKLREMTHQEPPWIDAFQGGGKITKQAMREYFETRLA